MVKYYKASVVAKGLSYKYGIDYLKTFVHVEKMNVIRVILAITVIREW